MNKVAQLRQEARNFAADVGTEAQQLKRRLQELNQEKAQIERKLELARTREERVHTYRPEIDGKEQCPRCWVRNERLVSLTNAPSTNAQDIYLCPSCVFKMMVEP